MNIQRKLLPLLAALGLCAGSGALASGSSLHYQYQGQDYEGYYNSAAPGAPLVLLLHDWDGLNDYEIRRADMIAELGYAVLAADMFGAGVRPDTTEDKQRHTGALLADREKMRGLMLAAIDAAGKAGADTSKAVAAGYCLGGGAALELARAGADLDGFVSFHGVLATPDGQDYGDAKGEILVLHGTADSAIPMTDFAALAEQLEQAGTAHEMVSYGGAPHAFTVFDTEHYQETADRRSWQRFEAFLSEKLSEK
ncbi:MAG: dienelactone hydrolase family protein [Porticoccaceae bacterium]